MGKRCKVRSKQNLAFALIAIVFIITLKVSAKQKHNNLQNFSYSTIVDSPPPIKRTGTVDSILKRNTSIRDSIAVNDTTKKDTLVRTIDTLNVKLSKDSLDAPVTYSAEDSGVLIIPTKEFILYGKANAKYSDVEVSASTINLNQEKQLLTAFGATDTTGNPLDKPKLVQGDMTSVSDTIWYNTRSQKGLTKGTNLQQGEMYVYAETVKKINNNTIYAWHGRFTTCNLDTPHFAFRTRKMKMITNKIAVSGPASPEFEGVPVPIGIPFGIYPLNRGRHSGLLPPQFASNEQFGLGLEGLGFYKVLSDNFDATVRGNIYSYGGWNANLSSRYIKRYKYTGNLNLAIQNTKILNSGGYSKEEFTKSKSFMINWSHSRDTKASPGSSFSANVNAGSTKFNRYVSNNSLQNFQNSLSSSIAYSRDWMGKYNLTVSANHSQNNNLRLVNLTLPTASFNVLTIYPFQKRESVGTPKWYEKLGVGYTGNFQNQVSFYDSAFSLRRMIDTAQYGATHSIPITLSLPQMGPIQLSPSISYQENWYGQKVLQRWDSTKNKVDTSISRGIYTARQMQMSLSASTRVFGTYQFSKTSKIQAIRHEIRPTMSLNYRPDMQKQYYKDLQVDSLGHKQRVSQFTGGIISPFGEGRSGSIGFGIDNTLEMKVLNRKNSKDDKDAKDEDTTTANTKKVRLLDGFGFNGSYNLIPSINDSFPLSNISIYARSTLFEKINITANANLDPYQVDEFGFRRSRLMLADNKLRPGRITNASVAVSTSFQSQSKDGKTDKERIPNDDFMTPDEQQRQLEYVRSNPAEYTDFNIPWSLQLSYSLSYTKQLASNYRQESRVYSNLSVNGDFSLTPRWKIGGNTYYDFTTSQIQTLTMFISREMHCWQMSINITPVGLYRSFNITINPKSGILRDLKINRSRFFYQ
ncbi:putative LPS assembly protein LptD [Segetibacter sp.]|jgi:LPS-assembly protein|uniref:putative LPS assembly protein LptD n=1 Tax=Segetibacter sp. TaxID=2231182 RepID=UPI00261B1DE7|nr:putative LPS assembly protein LptD [Segetibacter sp.]MCW3079212.1 LPS-assembly protein LptD [Segetibacter sp.]